jgi:PAS domain S-box-containing protein
MSSDVYNDKSLSVDYLSRVLRSINDIFILLDPEGKIQLVNDAACSILGYRENKLIGTPADRVFVDEESSLSCNKLAIIFKKSDTIRMEKTCLSKNGEEIPLLCTVTAVRDPSGEILGFICSGVNVSEDQRGKEDIQRSHDTQTVINKLLHLSLEKIPLRELMERAIELILSVQWLAFESKGCIFIVEKKPDVLVMMAEKGLAEPIKKACSSVPFGRCLCGRAAASGKIEFSDHLDERHETRYENISPHGHYCVPIVSSGKTLGLINMYLREGHKRNRGEEEFLRAIADTIAGVIVRKQIERRQEELLRELENANIELNDFAHIVSHDLKAPLRAIHSLTYWIASDYADKFDEDGREKINLLMGRVRRLESLINGILQYSRVGRIREQKIEVDLNTIIEEVVDMISPPENIRIVVEKKLPKILIDKTRIRQVFQNLLSNAVKFMDKPEGEIRITFSDEGNSWRFNVTDNGPGIEKKYFDKIFHIFQTLNARDRFESTGIGLSLVKKIIEMCGGSVWVESEVGKGSTFSFTLPKNKIIKENNDEN